MQGGVRHVAVHMEQVQHQGADHLLQRGVGEEDVDTGEGAVQGGGYEHTTVLGRVLHIGPG